MRNAGSCRPILSRRALAAAFLLVLLCPLAFALTFPTLTGRVVDEAGILDAPTRTALDEKLGALEEQTTHQLVVVTLKSVQGTSIEDYGYQLGRHWQIGQKGKNNGALLIVAPTERKVRIEVGYGLEGSLTDAVTRLIIENSILPRFRANDFPGGIARGADDIIAVLTGHADEYKQRAAKRPDAAAPTLGIGTLILLAIIAIIIIRSVSRSMFSRRRSGLWGAGPIFFPGSGSSWGSGSGSSWGGGSSSGGGFSGGGGSFGGGGSSGSW